MIVDGAIEAAINGGTAEADGLIRAVWPRANKIAYSILRNRTLAEDAAQEACAVLFRSIRCLRSASAFNVWFYRIVVRESLAIQRRNAHAEAEYDNPVTHGLDESLARLDLLKALSALTPAQRIAVALRYFADMTSPEIAEVLGIADSSVRFNIMCARRTLQQHLQDSNVTEDSHGVA